MISIIKYITIAILLLLVELVYFNIADHFNIVDKPNERSSHTRIVLRGGGIIFLFGALIWSAFSDSIIRGFSRLSLWQQE